MGSLGFGAYPVYGKTGTGQIRGDPDDIGQFVSECFLQSLRIHRRDAAAIKPAVLLQELENLFVADVAVPSDLNPPDKAGGEIQHTEGEKAPSANSQRFRYR